MPSTPAPLDGGTCQEDGCDKPTRARGFCVSCYYRHLRRGDIVSGAPSSKWRHRLSEVDAEARTAVCAECGPTKITPRDGGKRFRCTTDANMRSRTYKRAYRASKKIDMAAGCEICGSSEGLHWDHNHTTGAYRGTLCSGCNTAIGLLAEDVERIEAAASYLRQRGTKHDLLAADSD